MMRTRYTLYFTGPPWVIVQRGGQTDIQVNGMLPHTQSQPNEALVSALVRACQWKEDLIAGRVSTVKALAQREEVASSYVRRILRLSFLAPDLIEAILYGWQPKELTLEQFRRPFHWNGLNNVSFWFYSFRLSGPQRVLRQ